MNRYLAKLKSKFIPDLKVGTNNEIPRTEWIKETLLKIPQGNKILDAGAGELKYKPLCAHLQYVSQDLGEYNGEGDNVGLHTDTWDNSKLDIVSDIIDIPVEPSSFDAVMCIEVFEHITEPAKAVKEFSRVLKTGGKLIITAPFCSITHFAPFYFANGYSKYWYETILAENGFKVLEIKANGNYFEYIAQELRRSEEILERYAHLKLNWLERLSRYILLRKLQSGSKVGNASSEVLHFGHWVFAEKL